MKHVIIDELSNLASVEVDAGGVVRVVLEHNGQIDGLANTAIVLNDCRLRGLLVIREGKLDRRDFLKISTVTGLGAELLGNAHQLASGAAEKPVQPGKAGVGDGSTSLREPSLAKGGVEIPAKLKGTQGTTIPPRAEPARPKRVAKSHPGLLANRPVQGFPGHLFGQFIWDKEQSDRFLVLRRRFECDHAPERALLHIAVAHKYQLFVNGEYIGRGPCRSVDNSWTRYNTHDITVLLHPGPNSIAVLAFYHGHPNEFSAQAFGGLFVQAELFRDDTCDVVATDRTWRVRRPERYRRDTRIVNYYSDIPTEFVEADKDSGAWVRSDFDDRDWAMAWVRLADPGYESGATDFVQCLEPRPTPMLLQRRVVPAAIVQTGELDPAAAAKFGEADVAERLWYSSYLPLDRASVADIDNLLREQRDGAVLRSHAGEGGAVRDPFVILDFGRPAIGMPELVVEAPVGTVVEIGYADRLEQGRVPFFDPKAPTWGPWRHADRYVAGEGRQTWRLFEPRTPIRYLQVVFRTGSRTARLFSARLLAQGYPAEERGRFECSDETLTRFWRAAVDTVYMAMEDVLLVDSVRERGYYNMGGEMESHHLAMYAAYGDLAITDAHFRDTIRNQEISGNWRIKMIARVGDIENYSLYYPPAVLRRHQYFGKEGFLEEQYPTIVRLMAWFERQSDNDGLLYNLPHSVWLDWNDLEPHGANLEANALYFQALRDSATIAEGLGRRREAERWRQHAEKVRAAIQRQHWDEANGWFRDSVIEGRQAPQVTEISNALTVQFGIASDGQAARVVEHLVAWSKLPAIPEADVESSRRFATMLKDGTKIWRLGPLYFWHAIGALVRAGREADAWAYITAHHRKSLEGPGPHFLSEAWPRGVPTVSSNEASSIIGSEAGVAFLLSTCVLGVQPLEPGFARCRIEPRGGYLTWARGVFPSARGDIAVDWKRDGRRFQLDVTLPQDLECELVVPAPNGLASVTDNGLPCSARDAGAGRALINVHGGKHQVLSGR